LLALSAWVGATSVSASAAPIISSYDPNRHNRFLSGWPPPNQTTQVTQNPGLLAGVPYGPLDLSGVGWFGSGPTTYFNTTLISPQYVVGAAHVGIGSTVNFINRDGFLVTRTVTGTWGTNYRIDLGDGAGLRPANSDLVIARLSAPITPADLVSYYPVYRPQPFTGAAAGANLDDSPASLLNAYRGLEAVVVQRSENGIGQTVGRQTVVGLTSWTFNSPPYPPVSLPPNPPNVTGTAGAIFNYQSTTGMYPDPWIPNQVAGDWAHLQGGDSGSPTFAVVGNTLTLFGIHGGIGSVNIAGGSIPVFVDSLVPYYVDQINARMAANSDPDRVTLFVTPVPEPSAALLPAAVLVVIAVRFRVPRPCRP
jgi:hypothetical protein